jgi:hypothetical protein
MYGDIKVPMLVLFEIIGWQGGGCGTHFGNIFIVSQVQALIKLENKKASSFELA